MFRSILELCRISNLPTVWTNVLAAWIITSGPGLHWDARLGWLLLGGSLLYSAGMMLNDAADVAWDRAHRPERPIPSGRISLRTVWLMIIGGLVGGYAAMVILGGAHAGLTAGLVAAIVGYDLYHKPWAGSVILMGACRTLLYLAVGTIQMYKGISHTVLGLQALLLGIYIVGLTIAARSESAGGGSAFGKNFSRSLLCFPVFLPIWLLIFEGEWQPVCIVPFYLALLYIALRTLRLGGPHIGKAVGILLAGITIVDALAVAAVSLPVALAFVATAPVLRRWQRWVAAT